MNAKDRKDQIEQVLVQAKRNIGTVEADLAWQRLCRELENMTHPEAKPPRFKGLLNVIWVAATNEQS